MGHAGISAACMDGYWQFLSCPEHLGVAQICQVGHEPENSLPVLWSERGQVLLPSTVRKGWRGSSVHPVPAVFGSRGQNWRSSGFSIPWPTGISSCFG